MSEITRNYGNFIVLRSVGSSYPSAELTRNMGLNKGDCFEILFDEDKAEDVYLCKSAEGIRLKMYQQTLVFHARGLARKIGWYYGIDHKSVKINVGPKTTFKGKEVYPLITASLKFEIK